MLALGVSTSHTCSMTGNTPARSGEQDTGPLARERISAIGRTGLHVGVFCSAYDLAEKYTEPVKEFASLLAQRGHTLVWGGSDVGLMKVVASTAQDEGARIVGVSVDFLSKFAREGADEMIIVGSLDERKDALIERSDVLAVLVGGTGTLDELTDIVEQNKYNDNAMPIVVLNTDGFYDGYQAQMQRMERDNLLKFPLSEIVYFATTPLEAVDYIDQFLPNQAT